MMPLSVNAASIATWAICVAATAAVILRPRRWPEAVWAVAGSLLLVVASLLPVSQALLAVGKGVDVYLFLTGMMLLAELARREGLFDWLAAEAALWARGSAQRLFGLVYAVGVMVTVLLSNDATAVVLTPAVYAAARAARAEPRPYLYACAFVANAASFVLPISNPANLVVFGHQMPTLDAWLARFTLPSLLSIAATYGVLRWTQRGALRAQIAADVEVRVLPRSGRLTACGIAATALVLLAASASGWPLGLPTALAGAVTALAVLAAKREGPWGLVREISWSVLPLVAGLFVLVQALDYTGVLASFGGLLARAASHSSAGAALGAGSTVALGLNLTNNLPAGLIVGQVHAAHALPRALIDSLLIAIDVGPNLSVTGSLATILWLAALRREQQHVGAGDFLKLGLLVMPPALLLAITAALF